MLESLVANLLNRFLGSYIDNFDPKQLNVGIWSGDVKLRNLKLRKEALDKFRLPVDVSEGYLGELTLSIPWSNLAKKPVKVQIENVFLLASPKVDQEYDENEDRRRAQAVKQEKLDSAELLNRRQVQVSNEESIKNQSFTDSMTTKIIDNLQVTIKGVHVRYEDSISSPGNPFSVGLTLSEFSADSTDADWKPAFVQGNEKFTYKLAKLGSLAVYWNTDTQSLAGKSHDDFIKTFSDLISRSQPVQDHQYILKPVSGSGRITLNKLKAHDRPKTDIALLFDEIAFAIDQDQYRDALKMIDTFHFFLRHQEYRRYRPNKAVKEDPQAWLKFASTCVLRGIHEKNKVWSWENMKNRRDQRLRYIELFKKKQSETISLDESAELKTLEQELSYSDIRLYRSLAKNQLKKENVLRPKQVAKQAQGWLSWAWSGSHAVADQADAQGDTVMTEEQRKELYNAIEWDEKQAVSDSMEAPEDSIVLNVSARLNTGSLTLKKSKFNEGENILQLLFETFGAHFRQRPSSMFADLALGTMRVIDGTTPNTLYREILKVKDEGSIEKTDPHALTVSTSNESEIVNPLFYASFEQNPLSKIAQSELVARLKAMEIVYNPHCVEVLLGFVKPPKSHMESITALMEVAGEAAKDFKESGRASLEFALTEHKTIAAHLDLQAPLIIVPESCTDPTAACIVLDAGKIHIESNLVQQDKIKEIQAKNKQQLSDAEMQELQALCYDKFQLRLESTQILIGPSVSQALAALRSETDRRYHVVDRINMEFLLEISILPKNASLTLTKFRISGHLPKLSARVSDAKYKTMMRIIDIAIPNDDKESTNGTHASEALVPVKSAGRDRSFSTAFGKVPDLVIWPEKDNENAIDDDEKDEDEFVQAPMDLDDKDLLYRQKIFEFRFTVGELRGSLYKAQAQADEDGQLLVDIVLQQFALDFVLRQYDMQADVVLKSLIVEDRMNVDSPPEFQRLITSEHLGEDDEDQMDLVRVKYTQVKAESPEFQSIYGGVEKNVDVALSTINLIVTQKSILTLFDFILTTFTSPEVIATADLRNETSDKVTETSGHAPPEGKIRVKVELSKIVLILNQDGIRLATLKMSKGDVGVFLNGPTMRVNAKLGNLTVRDDVNIGSEGSSDFRQIISIQGDELVDFQYETFDELVQATYPGYDSSIYLRLSSVRINFLEEPLRKIMNFGSKFARMKALFDDARTAALSQVQQAQQRAGKMHFDLLVRTPIVIFPRISPQTSERDTIIANLGELFANNSFQLLDDREKSPSVNKIHAGIRNIGLSSKFHYAQGTSEELQMLDDADAMFDLEVIEREKNSDLPGSRVVGNVSDIKLKVTQSQYKFLMDLSQSIPAIFIGDGLDEEELELEETLSLQKLPAREESTADGKKIVTDLTPELGDVREADEPVEVYTSIDADLTIGDLVVELFTNTETSPVGNLEQSSLSRFSLNSTKAKFLSRSDSSIQGELNIVSFTVEDTRYNKINKFREVIPAITHNGHQFNASVTISAGAEQALMAMLTIDTPRMIFSLEHLFALQTWALSAFDDQARNIPTSEELDHIADSSVGPTRLFDLDEDAKSSLRPLSTEGPSRKPRRASQSPVDPIQQEPKAVKTAMSIAFRVNIVDPSIILVADSSKSDTEAIVVRARQVLIVQQTVLTLNVDKIGMYMTRMNEVNDRQLRVLDDLSMTLSLDSRSVNSSRRVQIINLDIEPLVLRLGLRDIMLIMQVAATAAKLSEDSNSTVVEKKSEGRRRSSIVTAPSASRRKSVGTGSKFRRDASQSLATRIKDDKSIASADTDSHGLMQSSIIIKEELRATFAGLRLVLIGDLHELPMIDISLEQFTVNIKDWSSEMYIDTQIRAFANVYNFSVSHWEPLIEPFDMGLHVAKSLGPDRLDVNVFSRRRIEMTLTSNTIALASKSYEYLTSNPDDILSNGRGNDAPYRILNMTGYTLSVWSDAPSEKSDDAVPARTLEDGEEISWAFEDWRTQRENLSNAEKDTSLGLKIEDDNWESVENIPVNREGERIYVLSQKSKTSMINHRIVVQVSLRADYVKYITIRSAFLFENRTKIPIELVAVDDKGNKQSKIYKIGPDQDCAAPIKAALDHGFKIRPDPGFHYQWSHQTLLWKELYVDPSRTINCKPVDGEGSNWNFICYARFDRKGSLAGRYPYQTIRISPPIEVNNLLPYDFEYRIFDNKTRHDHKNFLRKGLQSPIHTVDLKNVLLLSVTLVESQPAYETSQFAVIYTGDPESYRREDQLVLTDKNGMKTNLGLHYTELESSGGAFVVSVFARYLILNKTGLDIQIKSNSFLQKPRASSGQVRSSTGRKAAPYIHSYASEERQNRSLLKIGESSWSRAQSFEAIGSVTDVLIPGAGGKEIHIGIKVDEGEGKYKLTKVVSLAPRFVLKSNLKTDLNLREPKSSDILSLRAGERVPLHFMRASQERQLALAFPGIGNDWSNPFNIQDIGRVHLKVQKQGEHQQLIKIDILLEGATIFLQISNENYWPFEIRNESSVDFIYYQGNPYPDADSGIRYYPERYRIPARCSMPYAWDFPAADQHSLVLCPWTDKTSRTRHVRLDEIGSLEPFRVPGNPNLVGSEVTAVDLNIVADGPQRKLIIRNYNSRTSLYRPKRQNTTRQKLLRKDSSSSIHSSSDFETVTTIKDTRVTFKALLRLEGIGLSLVNARHQELAYISLRSIEASYSDSLAEVQYDLLCKWIQIDNQLYGGIYPILLYPTVVPKTGREMDTRPAFRTALTQAKDNSHGVFFVKYATILLQEMTMEVDEDFLFALLDFSKIPGASWSETHEGKLCDAEIELPEPQSETQASDMYFEVLHLQPAQLNLSFVRTERVNVEDKTSSRSPVMFFFNILTMALGNINDAPVRLNALLMENVLTSFPLLSNSIHAHYYQEFFYQVHKILGSADFLGNPVGLFNNISSGVADIFYEPYQGYVMSDRPQELGIGIAKGTASFVKKTVFGFSDSISKVTGSVSKGLSVATMDKQYQDKRRMTRARNRPKHALYGVQQGGMALISSVGSGVEGLARQPFEGAEKEGAAGFFKGVGKGLLGLATKPIIGVFDLASNVSEGIRNTTTVFDEAGLSKVRITRHIGKDGIVRPFNQTEALGLFWLRQLNNNRLAKEDYLAHYNITDEATLIITYQSMILARTKNFSVEWDVPFTDLKTIALEKTGIQLILKGVRGPFIPIEEESGRKFVYSKIKIAVENYNSSS